MLSKLNLNNDEVNFKDSGCRFSSSCLNCPIQICIYDDPSFVRNLEKNNRDENIIEDRSNGLSNQQIGAIIMMMRMPLLTYSSEAPVSSTPCDSVHG